MTRLAILALALALACGKTEPTGLAWTSDEGAAFERARAEHKGVMVDFWASWSLPSDEVERELRHERVAAAVRASFVPLKIDESDNTDQVEAIKARYRADTLPALVFVTTDGTVVGRLRQVVEEPELLGIIERASAQLHAGGSGTMHP